MYIYTYIHTHIHTHTHTHTHIHRHRHRHRQTDRERETKLGKWCGENKPLDNLKVLPRGNKLLSEFFYTNLSKLTRQSSGAKVPTIFH